MMAFLRRYRRESQGNTSRRWRNFAVKPNGGTPSQIGVKGTFKTVEQSNSASAFVTLGGDTEDERERSASGRIDRDGAGQRSVDTCHAMGGPSDAVGGDLRVPWHCDAAAAATWQPAAPSPARDGATRGAICVQSRVPR